MDGLQITNIVVKLLSLSFCLTQILLCCSSIHVYEDVTFGDVSCNKSGITVGISLKKNFQGKIYSHGNFFNPNCSYTSSSTSKNISLFFPLTDCGTLMRKLHDTLYISNLVVIQKHRFVETASDMMHKVSCKWFYSKSEDTEEVSTISNHSSRYKNNLLESWMDFQLGSSILGKDVLNNLLVGDEFLMVVHLKDGGTNKDLKVGSCWAYDGETMEESQYILQIYDRYACESSDWVSGFNLTKEMKNISDSMTYAAIKAFKFPMTNDLHITCSVQVCKTRCWDYCEVPESARSYSRISKRSTSGSFNDKSLRERYKLMKATIKALGAKLIEINRAQRSDENLSFRRRIANSEMNSTTSYEVAIASDEYDYSTEYGIIPSNSLSKDSSNYTEKYYANDMHQFNLTNKIVVFKSHDINFRHDSISPIELSVNCVSKLKFGMSLGALCLISSFLLIACIGLALYLRKEKKRHKINNYLLYNMF